VQNVHGHSSAKLPACALHDINDSARQQWECVPTWLRISIRLANGLLGRRQMALVAATPSASTEMRTGSGPDAGRDAMASLTTSAPRGNHEITMQPDTVSAKSSQYCGHTLDE
jgi:hypothetical protein